MPNDDLDRIRAELAAGRKIAAIKLYREATGAGLADAKQAVESLEAGRTIAAPGMDSASNDDIEQIQAAVFAGEKMKAIKLYRAATGEQLKDSKEFIEALEDELRRTEPSKFMAPPAKSCGVGVLYVVAIAATAGWLLM